MSQILGPIQVLASSSKKHDYNNSTFEVHANLKKNKMYEPKKKYYPRKIIKNIWVHIIVFGIVLMSGVGNDGSSSSIA